jgi:hypothetical protein
VEFCARAVCAKHTIPAKTVNETAVALLMRES